MHAPTIAVEPNRTASGDTQPGAGSRSSKDRFIEAAAHEFIDTGYDGCTIRAVAARAGTSVASLSRNWTGKRHLFGDVFGHHFGIINEAQNRNLDSVATTDGAPDLVEVLHAFYRPVLSPYRSDGEGPASHHVYCKALSDPSDEAREIIRPLVADVRARMIGFARQCLPDLSEQELFLAMTVINGTYVYPQIQGARLASVMGLEEETIDWERASLSLARMVAGGLSTFHGAKD
ncbi:MAG TPA: TetR/AcrR family transcriptional regulator [Sphingomonadaceae bacterium]|nr:TetR/AcrR family transcriptional regulator [Sphingomonadaceae bacterium]